MIIENHNQKRISKAKETLLRTRKDCQTNEKRIIVPYEYAKRMGSRRYVKDE